MISKDQSNGDHLALGRWGFALSLAALSLALAVIACISLTLTGEAEHDPTLAVPAVMAVAALTWICMHLLEKYGWADGNVGDLKSGNGAGVITATASSRQQQKVSVAERYERLN